MSGTAKCPGCGRQLPPVVIGSAAIILIQLVFIGFNDFYYLYDYEQVIYLLAFIGIFYLAWFSWRSIRGIILPPLLED